MKVFHHREALGLAINAIRKKGKKVGFVPTMGALHQGHLSLMKAAHDDECQVVVSIYVNPTQFDNASDLEKYPRTLEADVALLETLDFEPIVYAPDSHDLYGDKIEAMSFNFGKLERQMEGAFRDGHFDGVGTVLTLLFNAVTPDMAYFGQKDFQQLQIVKKLVAIKKFDIQIIGCPIIREDNGLAMSSRNKRLTKKEFERASLIYRTLNEVANSFDQYSIAKLTHWVKEQFLNVLTQVRLYSSVSTRISPD